MPGLARLKRNFQINTVFKKFNFEHLLLLATVSYPFLLHYWVLTEQFRLSAWYIFSICLLLALQNFIQNHKHAAIVMTLIGILLGILLYYNNRMVIFIPSILIPLLVAYVFAKTLSNGQEPLVTFIARKIRRTKITEKELQYTYTLTWLWAVFLFAISVEAALLALFSDIETWSYITNFINYILVAIFATAEYMVRKVILKDLEHPGFIQFIKQLVKLKPHKK